jgi:hypothetical protein
MERRVETERIRIPARPVRQFSAEAAEDLSGRSVDSRVVDARATGSLHAAWAHRLRGDGPAARAAFDSALVLLDSVLRELPDDRRVHAARGLALAGLGRRDEALREARWLRQSLIYREDAFAGPMLAEDHARISAQAGESGAALDEIERLLARPSFLSVHALRLDPLWDPIRHHPRFKALLAEYRAQ